MKLGEFYDVLTEYLQKHPDYCKLDVVSSSDDEGNSFQHLTYHPAVGVFTGGYTGDFETLDPKDKETKPNAICIN